MFLSNDKKKNTKTKWDDFLGYLLGLMVGWSFFFLGRKKIKLYKDGKSEKNDKPRNYSSST